MTAQDATKARKNAKARREKKKQDGKEGPIVRRDRGGATDAGGGPKGNPMERLAKFGKGVLAETRRVSWPSKQELVAGTITTVFILLVFAGWLGGLDWILRRIMGIH